MSTAPKREFHVPGDTIEKQARASDPTASAWVEANAGSGKTFVLTRRVLRLLLSGATPNSLLCLTYTKAAAAEMRQRVTLRLAQWARENDAKLAADLTDTLGRAPDPQEAGRARALFAHALETPGGLKINTIHAFCEAILQRFPREAGVPVDFTVIAEDEGARLMTGAREAVLAQGLKGQGPCADAVAALFAALSDSQIEAAISNALEGGRKLEPVLADPDAANANLRALLGLRREDTPGAIEDQVLSGLLVDPTEYEAIWELTPPGMAKRPQFEDRLLRVDQSNPTPTQLFSVFLTGDGTVPKQGFPNKKVKQDRPDLAERLLAESERLEQLFDKYRATRIAHLSAALTLVIKAILNAYEAQKRARSLMDFDDLVAHTVRLLTDKSVSAWVRYKLDAGIAHILVDESQDTNPDQWAVITALADDFYAGDGVGRAKTMFAVGDPKQSIYSFQGAEPRLFRQTGEDFSRRAKEAGQAWEDIELETSFRSQKRVLDGADLVAARPDIAAALFATDRPVRHESARKEHGGTITLWPTFPKPGKIPPQEHWPLEPVENLASPTRQIGGKIAQTIAGWISGALPSPIGRAVKPDDILILVQARSGVFGEIVSALKKARIASPGADKLPVSAHIAVDDLLGLADILLNPADDLLLAAILRSPLFGLTEDELFDIAHHRDKNTRLWAALKSASAPAAKAAYDELFALRSRLDLDRPYAFFAHVLYARGGLKRFHTRLGLEVDEVVAEFLDLALEHEQSEQPSLTGFVAKMRASEVVIKRDLVQTAAGVRIMTVHGAKGLEAPIVILADAASTARATDQKVFFAEPGAPPFLLYCPAKPHHCATSLPLREAISEREKAEYWRNLYVAMTRAEDALFVTGATGEKNEAKNTWYEALSDALAEQSESLPDAVGMSGGLRFPIGATLQTPEAHAPEERTSEIPFARANPQRKPEVPIVTPSGIGAKAKIFDGFETYGEALLDATSARLRGIALHALLQHLSDVPQSRRAEVALVAAHTLLPDHGSLAPEVAEAALSIMTDPVLSDLFGPSSRAEVGFSLTGTRNGKPIRLEGRIDRLVIGDTALVIDYKSDFAPPNTVENVPAAYLTQLALYRLAMAALFPGMAVRAAILWTSSRHLMEIDPELLSKAVGDVTLA